MPISLETGRYEQEAAFRGSLLTTGITPSFIQGRSYRAYKEFTANTVLRFTATKPFMLTLQSLWVDTGAARATVSVGGTAGGTYTALPTVFARNGTVQPVPAPDVLITQGGTITGGTEREVLRVAAGNAAVASGSGGQIGTVRLLPAGSYYISIVVTGATSGVYGVEYDELGTSA